jgi:hypothetical protein
MKRALVVMVVVVLVGAGIISGYQWLHESSTTNGASTHRWTGEYFWQTGPADAPSDAVLLTLLQSPSGVSGTWTEAAATSVYPLGLSGLSRGGMGSRPVQGTDVTASTMTLTGTAAGAFQVTFQANNASVGLSLTYTPSGGGIQTLNFDRVTSAQQYNQAVAAIQRQDD